MRVVYHSATSAIQPEIQQGIMMGLISLYPYTVNTRQRETGRDRKRRGRDSEVAEGRWEQSVPCKRVTE